MTHDQEEALELAHRIVVMHRGSIEQVGVAAEIYNDPSTPFVAGFVGSANVIRGIVMEGRVAFGAYSIGGPIICPMGRSPTPSSDPTPCTSRESPWTRQSCQRTSSGRRTWDR